MDKNATLQRVLDQGRAHLDKGDIQGYWKLMSEHSGYAKIAGEVASGKGVFAHIANARLQRAAKKELGRELSEIELADIRSKIANADQKARQNNLKAKGHIGVSGQDTVEYHRRVFEDKNLPADTYTPAHLQNIAGSYWSKVTGTPTHDVKDKGFIDPADEMKRRYDADPDGFMDELDKAGVDIFQSATDAAQFMGDDKTLTTPSGVGHDPLEGTTGPNDRKNPSTETPGGKEQPQDDSLRGDAGDDKLKGGESDDDLENASPEARAFMKNLLEPGKPIDEIMMKRPQDFTEGEAREIMIARMDAKTHDERERLFKAEKGFFDHFFGDEPIGPDAAGRTMEPKPIRPIPQTPKPLSTSDGEPLGKGLRRIGLKVVRDAKDDGLASVIKHLQGGLNILGEAKAPKDGAAILAKLKEDGDIGPRTTETFGQLAGALGPERITKRFGEFLGFF